MLAEDTVLYSDGGGKRTVALKPIYGKIATGASLRGDTRTKKVSPAVSQIHPAAIDELKNAYSLEFLSLPGDHNEDDLRAALLRNLGRFITELGRDEEGRASPMEGS